MSQASVARLKKHGGKTIFVTQAFGLALANDESREFGVGEAITLSDTPKGFELTLAAMAEKGINCHFMVEDPRESPAEIDNPRETQVTGDGNVGGAN